MILGLVVALALAAPAAPKGKGGWVVLVRTVGDVPATWREALQKAAEDNKGQTWVPPPAVTLDEAQLALGCAGWSESCAGQIATMTGATSALIVELSAKGGGMWVNVEGVKATGQPLIPQEQLELPGTSEEDLDFARDFVKNFLKGTKEKVGYVVVDTDVPGADVLIDGEKKGKTRWAGRVNAGDHKLVITMEGKAPYQKELTVKAGAVTSEITSLSAAGPSTDITPAVGNDVHEVTTAVAVPPTPGEGNTGVVGWSLAGAGGLFAVVGGVFASATVYNLYIGPRELCGPEPQVQCVPKDERLLFGIYEPGPGRADFGADAPAWIGGSLAVIGVGALLIGTGITLAMDDGPVTTEAVSVAPSR